MKLTRIGAIIGLTALVSGCDETKDMDLGGCDVGGFQVRVIYHQLQASQDRTDLEIYKDGKIVGSIHYLSSGDWIQCDDNRKLNVMPPGGLAVYFSVNPEKEAK